MDRHYEVSWTIDISAPDPRNAAEQALAIIQEPGTECTMFVVKDDYGNKIDVDLNVGVEE